MVWVFRCLEGPDERDALAETAVYRRQLFLVEVSAFTFRHHPLRKDGSECSHRRIVGPLQPGMICPIRSAVAQVVQECSRAKN